MQGIKDFFSDWKDPVFSLYVQKRYIAPAALISGLLLLVIGLAGA